MKNIRSFLTHSNQKSSSELSDSNSCFFNRAFTLSISLIIPLLFGKILLASSNSPRALSGNPKLASAKN